MKLYRLLFFVVLSAFCFSATAQTSSELKRKKEALQRDIALLQDNLNDALKGKKLTLSQVNALKTKIRLQQKKIDIVNTEIKNIDNEITKNSNKVRNLTGQLGDLKKEYANMIRFAQRNKNAYDKMMFIFAAKSFNQAYKRIKYLQQFGQYRKKQAGYIEGKQAELNNQIVVLDKDLKQKSKLLSDQEQERIKLEKSKTQQTVVLNKYSKQEKQFRVDIKKRKDQQNAIDRALRDILKRELEIARKKAEEEDRLAAAKAKAENRPAPTPKAKASNSMLTLAPEAAKLNAAFESNKGGLPWPVESKLVTERFGKHTFEQATYINDGITIRTSENANVRAVFNGEVSRVMTILGKYTVVIKHGLYYSIYVNLKSVSVTAGSKVSTKQTIGVASENDNVPELQFQIHKLGTTDTTPLDPESWLAQ